MTTPRVSIVVPARNEEKHIEACLDSILAQTYTDFEVIVVDGESEDRTAELVAGYSARDPRVRLITNPRRITPTQLNAGLAAARGELMVRIDGHATVEATYVERGVKHLDDGWDGAGGRVVSRALTPAGAAVAAVMSSPFGIGNAVHHFDGEAQAADHVPFPAYRVATVRALGGWDEELPTNQDFELDYRLVSSGHRLVYDPAMVIDYHCQQSVRGFWRQFRRYGKGKAQVLALHPASLRVRHLAAPALVAGLVVSALVAPWLGWWAALPALAYLVVLAAGTAHSWQRTEGLAARLRLPLVFAAGHLGWGLGLWQGVLGLLRTRRGSRPLSPAAAAPAPAPR